MFMSRWEPLMGTTSMRASSNLDSAASALAFAWRGRTLQKLRRTSLPCLGSCCFRRSNGFQALLLCLPERKEYLSNISIQNSIGNAKDIKSLIGEVLGK
jgi:hypothetical protein